MRALVVSIVLSCALGSGSPSRAERPLHLGGSARYFQRVVNARIRSARESTESARGYTGELRTITIKVGKTYLAEADAYLAKLRLNGPRFGQGRKLRFQNEVLSPLAAEIRLAKESLGQLPGANGIEPYEIDIDGYEAHLGQQAAKFAREHPFRLITGDFGPNDL